MASLSILASFLLALLYVRAHGVGVFYADEWDFVALVREASRGTLGPADLLAHHNEHVYLFPWGLMLLLGGVTGYDTVPFMYGVQVCLLVTTLAVFYAYRKSVERTAAGYLLFLPVPFLLLGFRQHENMLWGNQISFAFAQTFSVLALCSLYAASIGRPDGGTPTGSPSGLPKGVLFAAGAFCAVVASGSAVQGLLVWPAGLLLLLLAAPEGDLSGTPAASAARRLAGRLPAGVWGVLGAAVWVGYLLGYEKPGSTPPLTYVLGHPVEGLGYFLTLAGSSLFWREGAAFAAGVLLVCLAAAVLLVVFGSRRGRENSFWISLLFFSALSLALVTVGRSGFEEDQLFARAAVSRFTAFSIPGVVALYAMATGLATRTGSRVALVFLCALLALALTGAARSLQLGPEAGAETREFREEAARVLLDHRSRPVAEFLVFAHEPTRVKRYARFLDRRDLNVFSAGSPAEGRPGVAGVTEPAEARGPREARAPRAPRAARR